MPDEVEQDLDDRRGDIAAAFKEASAPAESAPEATPEPAAATESVEASEITGDRARDKTGRFVKQDAKPAEPDKQAILPPAAKPAPPGQGAALPVATPAAAPAFKPPQSWKPTVREHWGALPAEVQAEVDRREREIAKALQESAEASKGQERGRRRCGPTRRRSGQPEGIPSSTSERCSRRRTPSPTGIRSRRRRSWPGSPCSSGSRRRT
jgi:hypothetical protein